MLIHLKNRPRDIKLVKEMLLAGTMPDVKVRMGVFLSDSPEIGSLEYTGKITEVDEESGYCEWINEINEQMPCMNINTMSMVIRNDAK